MDKKANDGDDEDKQQAHQYDVHEQDLSRGRYRLSDSRPRRSFGIMKIRSPRQRSIHGAV
jgi:hypothetical protein